MCKTVIATIALDVSHNSHANKSQFETKFKLIDEKLYSQSLVNLILTHLFYTPYDIVAVVDDLIPYHVFKDNPRVNIFHISELTDDPLTISNKFNMHLKRFVIKQAVDMGYEQIVMADCDCFVTGWNEESFENFFSDNEFDIAFVGPVKSKLNCLYETSTYIKGIVDKDFDGIWDDKLWEAPNVAETRVFIKNNADTKHKLQKFLAFWDKIAKNNRGQETWHDGVFYGTSATYADMIIKSLKEVGPDFHRFCKISHAGGVLNCFGTKQFSNEEFITRWNKRSFAFE